MLPSFQISANSPQQKLTPIQFDILHVLHVERYLPYIIPLIEMYLDVHLFVYSASYIDHAIQELIGMGFVTKQILGLARKPKSEKRNECVPKGERSKKNIICITNLGEKAYKEQTNACYRNAYGTIFAEFCFHMVQPKFPLYEDYKSYPKSISHMELEERNLIEKQGLMFASAFVYDQYTNNRPLVKYSSSSELKPYFDNKEAKASRIIGVFVINRSGQEYFVPVYNSGNFIHSYRKGVESSMVSALWHILPQNSRRREEDIILGNSLFVLEQYYLAFLDRLDKQSSSSRIKNVSIKKSHPYFIEPEKFKNKYFIPLDKNAISVMNWVMIPEEYRVSWFAAYFNLREELEQLYGCPLKISKDPSSCFYAESIDYLVFVDMVFNLNELNRFIRLTCSSSDPDRRTVIVVCGEGQGEFYKHMLSHTVSLEKLHIIEKDLHQSINYIRDHWEK